MSTVLFFSNIPHVVRYGSIDDDNFKTWMHFYRNGIHFDIAVSEEDIRDTPFFHEWKPIVMERLEDGQKGLKSFLDRWRRLCSCVILQSLPLLEELAPPTYNWKTLHNHFHTPTYNIKMVKPPDSGDAVPIIEKGPITKPSFAYSPVLIKDLDFGLPNDLPLFSARHLTLLNQDEDYRKPPYKVRPTDTAIPQEQLGGDDDPSDQVRPHQQDFFFHPLEHSWTAVETGKEHNPSLSKIKTLLNVHNRLSQFDHIKDLKIPRITGIVIDKETEQDEPRFAGLLQTYIHHSLPLNVLTGLRKPSWQTLQYSIPPDVTGGPERFRISAIPNVQLLDIWREQVRRILETLHGCDVTCGAVWAGSICITCKKSTDDEGDVVVHADTDSKVWLIGFKAGNDEQADEAKGDDDLGKTKVDDFQALEETFQKVKSHLSSSS